MAFFEFAGRLINYLGSSGHTLKQRQNNMFTLKNEIVFEKRNTQTVLWSNLGKGAAVISIPASISKNWQWYFFLAGLYTEWFDLDDPCWEGDIESATQVYIQENFQVWGRP